MKQLLLLAFTLMSLNSFAQVGSTDAKIELRLNRLSDLISREGAHRFLTEPQKRDLLKTINNAIAIIRLDDTGPGPGPGPGSGPLPVVPAACGWYDGVSQGITQRGWHAFRVINNVHFSLKFYGNNGNASTAECQKDIIFNIEGAQYSQVVRRASSTSCTCGWYEGDKLGITQRGWHMAYRVPMAAGGEALLSSIFYGNNGNASQGECNRALVLNNYVCPIR